MFYRSGLLLLKSALLLLSLHFGGCSKLDSSTKLVTPPNIVNVAELNSSMELASQLVASCMTDEKDFARDLAASVENSYYLDENILFKDLLQPSSGTILKGNLINLFRTKFEAAYMAGKHKQVNAGGHFEMATAGFEKFMQLLIDNEVQLYWPYSLHTGSMNKPITVGFAPADATKDGFKGYQLVQGGETPTFKEVLITDEFEKENPVWLITKNNGFYKDKSQIRPTEEAFQAFKKYYNKQITLDQYNALIDNPNGNNNTDNTQMAATLPAYNINVGYDRLGYNPVPGAVTGVSVKYSSTNSNSIEPSSVFVGGNMVSFFYTKANITSCAGNAHFKFKRNVALILDWQVNTRKQGINVTLGWVAVENNVTTEFAINSKVNGSFGYSGVTVSGGSETGYTYKKSVTWKIPNDGNLTVVSYPSIYRSLFNYMNYTSLNTTNFGGNTFRHTINGVYYYERNWGSGGNGFGFSLSTDPTFTTTVLPRSYMYSYAAAANVMKSELDEPMMGDYYISASISNVGGLGSGYELRNYNNQQLVQDTRNVPFEEVWTVKYTPNGSYLFLSKMSAVAGNKKYITALDTPSFWPLNYSNVGLANWNTVTPTENTRRVWLTTPESSNITSAFSFQKLARYFRPTFSTGYAGNGSYYNNVFIHLNGPYNAEYGGKNTTLTAIMQRFSFVKVGVQLPNEDENYAY